MIDQTEQLKKELHLVRTQRETANRVHQEVVRKTRQHGQVLRAKINRVLRRGVMPHEARAALESGSNQRLPVVHYVVQTECLVLATARHAAIFDNAMVANKEQSEITKELMFSQLVSVETERIRCRVKFNKRREALAAEMQAISNEYDKAIQYQNTLLDSLDPQRIPKTLEEFFRNFTPFFRDPKRGQFTVGRAA